MPEIPHFLIAWFTGFVAGFLISFPIGPINLTIINEGARRGFVWGILIGAGSTVMDSIYCSVAFMGFASLFEGKTIKATMELVSFLLMLYLGLKYFRAARIDEHSPSADAIEEKLHPHSAFMIGFVRTLGNPGILLLWITLTATFLSHEWVEPTTREKVACIVGASMGTTFWFFLLSYAVGRRHKKFTRKTLLKMEHFSGACLLLIALSIGVRLVLLLRKQ